MSISPDSVDFFANQMATSITLDLQTHERAYLYIFHALEDCISSQIAHGLSWEITSHDRVEAISGNEPNREIVEGEHPEPKTEFEALQQEDEILEEEIDETATELELRHFMEFSSQERYIFRGVYQQMETNDLELDLLRGIEASSQMECPLRPAARSAVESLAKADIRVEEEVICTVFLCNINVSDGDGRVLP
ncbi:hypothetical protein AMTRI_Chr07g30940 [Amborella trichopoda]